MSILSKNKFDVKEKYDIEQCQQFLFNHIMIKKISYNHHIINHIIFFTDIFTEQNFSETFLP